MFLPLISLSVTRKDGFGKTSSKKSVISGEAEWEKPFQMIEPKDRQGRKVTETYWDVLKGPFLMRKHRKLSDRVKREGKIFLCIKHRESLSEMVKSILSQEYPDNIEQPSFNIFLRLLHLHLSLSRNIFSRLLMKSHIEWKNVKSVRNQLAWVRGNSNKNSKERRRRREGVRSHHVSSLFFIQFLCLLSSVLKITYFSLVSY